MHRFTMSRRQSIRLTSFFAAGITVVVTLCGMSYTAAHTERISRQKLESAVLCRMAEEAYVIRTALSAAETDTEAIAGGSRVLVSLAALLDTDTPAKQTADNAAAVFRSIAAQTTQKPDATRQSNTALLCRRFAERTTELLCDAALLSLSAEHTGDRTAYEDAFTAATEALSVIADALSPDALRLADSIREEHLLSRLSKPFAGETVVSSAEAAAFLRTLPGEGGTFFGQCTTEEDCYRFSCKNGFAVVSVHGGHLLAYLLAPQNAHTDHDCVTRALSAGDLEACADAFSAAVGCIRDASHAVCRDRHGIRYYKGKEAVLGVRMCDGKVLSFVRLSETEAP